MSRLFVGIALGVVVAISVAILSTRIATAQTAASATTPGHSRIALVDMARVFKESVAFARQLDALKDILKTADDSVRKSAAEIQRQSKQVESLEKGSEERRELEDEVALKNQALESLRIRERKRFAQAEAAIYHDIYLKTSTIVAEYAEENSIELVMRYSAEPLNHDDPKKLIEGLNRQIIYQNKLDITDTIISLMNERHR